MVVADDSHTLAHRLRALREERWPDVTITQSDLAQAFSAEKPASVPLLSSWESRTKPKTPPLHRLAAYATFFATKRSVASRPYRLVPVEELTPDELRRRDELLRELTDLRAAAAEREDGATPAHDRADRGFWYFHDRHVITIVVAQLPADMRAKMPYSDPTQPDYVELYTYADLDALIELHGHIRALNPRSQVNFRIASDLAPDDYTTHLVLLGGVDWNLVTRELLDRVDLPITQVARHVEDEAGGFVVRTPGGDERLYAPKLGNHDGREVLLEDVGHFYRGTNPFNHKRTVTICNGQYGRGTLGVVRALTDSRFRDRNAEYLGQRFAGLASYSVLTRVMVVNGQVVTPDWNLPYFRLFEWPEGQS
ncbi:XRE family transcriptional regulator [Saccharothrix sp. S26]|uniref:XRE family transcriptional regulator n=1 Tax=Saccharothrix sp. S26 TaxID=2907215 RepID=UPI001F1ED346|nr:XRE family transcriptional regulator [Saccharothrix sp. S26]MCE6993366.1 XRE family transcriptional regulator [Saccharothrix sp. S26]